MLGALLTCLCLAAAPAPGHGHHFPLAAALVSGDRAYLVDVPTRTATPVPLDGMLPEEADLTQDKKWIAVSARPAAGKTQQVFLVKVGEWTRKEVKTSAEGDHRFPRFSPDGKYLYFSAAQVSAEGGPANPLRIHRLRMADGQVEQIATKEGQCEFSPTPIGADAIAHVTTGCLVMYDLAVTDLRKKKTEVVAGVPGPTTELAASPDGKKLVEVVGDQQGTGFYVKDGPGKPRRIAGLSYASEARLQPRFICPKDLVFLNEGKVWALDTKSGEIREVFAMPQPHRRGGKGP